MSEHTTEELQNGVYEAQRVFDKLIAYYGSLTDEPSVSDITEAVAKVDEVALRALLHIGHRASKVALQEADRRGLNLGVVFG